VPVTSQLMTRFIPWLARVLSGHGQASLWRKKEENPRGDRLRQEYPGWSTTLPWRVGLRTA